LKLLQIVACLVLLLRLVWMLGRWLLRRGKTLSFAGEPVRVNVSRNKHGGVSGVRVTLEIADRLRFSLLPEDLLDRWAKSFGIVREWQTGDTPFDDRVFIVSEDAVLLETLSVDRELRELVARLLAEQRGVALFCDRGNLWVDCAPSESLKDASDELLREQFARSLCPTLVRLRERLLRIATSDWQPERDLARRRQGWLSGAAGLCAVAGISAFFLNAGTDSYQVVREMISRYTLFATLSTGAALLVALALWLRATPLTHRVLFDVLLAAIPGAWFAASGALGWYNRHYDVSSPERRSVRVEQTYETIHRSRTSYHLVVAAWPDVRGQREVLVNPDEYRLMTPGGCVDVVWHRGRLGDGWISEYNRSESNRCDGGVE
jgi:hypothetical protein